jgi:hypothetical protein
MGEGERKKGKRERKKEGKSRTKKGKGTDKGSQVKSGVSFSSFSSLPPPSSF